MQADRADAAVARAIKSNEPLGPLHGVPVTIKENVDQEGCATVNGVAAFRDVIAPADSPVVANWKRAGAVIIGRTNTPAFSFRLDTVNDFRGRTYSPWSRAHTPGGSSGGASSSVAAGITPLAHGNDIAGSVRYPAYCTGLAGLRPSFGRVPAYNPSAKAERTISAQLMSVQGALARYGARRSAGLRGDGASRRARSVVDARAARGAGARGPDPRRGRGPRRKTWAALRLSPAVAAAMREAASALADAGYEIVDEKTPGFARAFDLWFEMLIPEFRRFMHADFERDGDDGIRTAMRFVLDNVPETRRGGALALARRARARHPRMEPVSRAHAARADAGVHAAALRARLRRREQGAHDASLARIGHTDGGAGAGPAGDGRAHRAGGGVADRRADRRTALSRGPDAGGGRSDRGARAAPHARSIRARKISVAAGVQLRLSCGVACRSIGDFHATASPVSFSRSRCRGPRARRTRARADHVARGQAFGPEDRRPDLDDRVHHARSRLHDLRHAVRDRRQRPDQAADDRQVRPVGGQAHVDDDVARRLALA